MPTDLAISTPFLITILAVVMLLLAGGAFFAVYVSFCDRLFKRIFHRPRPIPQVDRSPMEIDRSTIFGRGKNWFYTYRTEWLSVRVKAFDDTPLSAYFRPSADRSCRNIAIFVHGYNEHPAEMAAYAKLLMKKIQCHCLIVHQRAHGISGGRDYTYGLKESVDLETWFEFARNRIGPNCRIYVVGRGTGATAALLAAEQEGFCPNVCGIIADSPAESLTALLKAVAHKESSMKPEAFIYRIRQLASKRFGFDINMCDCALYAGRIKVPVLLFQGGDDDVCLPSGTRNIYDNMRCKKRMVVIDSAKHLMAYEVAQATYEREVQKFIESCVMRLVKIGAV